MLIKSLARAWGVPVGWRSGGRLATTLLATIINIILAGACGVPVGRRLVVNWLSENLYLMKMTMIFHVDVLFGHMEVTK